MNLGIWRIAFLMCAFMVATIIAGCDNRQSRNTTTAGDWRKDPNKKSPAKTGDTFSSVSKRLLGGRVDSLGLPLANSDEVSYYDYRAGSLSLRASTSEPGHQIIKIEQFCSWESPLAGGEFFGEMDCSSDPIDKLVSQAESPGSAITALCIPLEPMIQIVFINQSDKVFWRSNLGELVSIGSYTEIASLTRPLPPWPTCTKNQLTTWKDKRVKVLSERNSWYAQQGVGEVRLNSCIQTEGPGNLIDTFERINITIRTSNEVKDNDGRIVQTTLYVPNKGPVTFYRGKKRCEQAIASEAASRKTNTDRYK